MQLFVYTASSTVILIVWSNSNFVNNLQKMIFFSVFVTDTVRTIYVGVLKKCMREVGIWRSQLHSSLAFVSCAHRTSNVHVWEWSENSWW
jgi:hypothetical protein